MGKLWPDWPHDRSTSSSLAGCVCCSRLEHVIGEHHQLTSLPTHCTACRSRSTLHHFRGQLPNYTLQASSWPNFEGAAEYFAIARTPTPFCISSILPCYETQLSKSATTLARNEFPILYFCQTHFPARRIPPPPPPPPPQRKKKKKNIIKATYIETPPSPW